MKRNIVLMLAATFLLSVLGGPAGGNQHDETADILDQGGGSVLVEDGARLLRAPDALSLNIAMPTPAPGTYMYPETGVFSGPGHPEGFTLWAFVFNFPGDCSLPCNFDDLGNTPAQGGAFFVTGHMVGGGHLTLGGQISTEDSPGLGVALQNPEGAEVHIAVAPHGGIDPDKMPDQIQTPTGPSTVWWTAGFPAP